MTPSLWRQGHHWRHAAHCRWPPCRSPLPRAMPVPPLPCFAVKKAPKAPCSSLLFPLCSPGNPSPRPCPPFRPPPPSSRSPSMPAAPTLAVAAPGSAPSYCSSPAQGIGRGRSQSTPPSSSLLRRPPPSGLLRPRRLCSHTPGERAHHPDPFSLSLSLWLAAGMIDRAAPPQPWPPACFRRPLGPTAATPRFRSASSSY